MVEETIGKWNGIFNHFGIEVGDGRHCPCPMCGGADRFRFDDKEGKGTYYCNHCGAGDGFNLLQNKLGIDFKEAINEVKKIIGGVVYTKPKEQNMDPETLRKMFTDSNVIEQNDFAGAYLNSRGLTTYPETLRSLDKCYESETKKNHPAMLAVVRSHEGEGLTLHRTYLTMYGDKAPLEKCKKLMPALKKITGGAIRLFPATNGTIGIAEGIETAIACYEQTGVPTWSAISSTLLEAFKPPLGIKNVIIFGDNDKNFAGQKAAYTLANRLVIKDKLSATVMIPDKPGTDWLDMQKESKC